MREFASATLKEVEVQFGCARSDWGSEGAEFTDSLLVRFFLEEVTGQTQAVYHAMVQVPCADGGSGLSEPIRFGHPSELPEAWLDAGNVRFYFQASVDEFRVPGFVEAYLAGDD